MIDPELLAKLDEIGTKADRAYVAAEKVRTYMFWTGIISAALIIIPFIGLLFVLPAFMNNYVAPLTTMSTGVSSSSDLLRSVGL